MKSKIEISSKGICRIDGIIKKLVLKPKYYYNRK